MRNEIIFRNLDILIEIHEKHQKMKDDTDILHSVIADFTYSVFEMRKLLSHSILNGCL